MTAEEHAPQSKTFREIPSLIYLLKSAEAASRTQMDDILRDTDVTTMQYLTLGVLLEHDELSGAALARRTFVRPQSVHDTLRSLEAKGYIERRSTSQDRRERVISITAEGVELMHELEPTVATFDAALCDRFTQADEDLLRSLLRRVKINASAFQR